MQTYFDTQAVTSDRQFDLWRDILGHRLYRAQAARGDSGAFRARLDGMRLGQFELFRIASSPVSATLDAVRAKAQDDPAIYFSLVLRGEWRLEQDGRQATQRAGDLVLWDSARPLDSQVTSPLQSVCAKVPRSLAAALGVHTTRALTARIVRNENGLGAMASQLIQSCAELTPAQASPGAHRCAEAMASLVFGALEQQVSGEPASDAAKPRLALAKAFLLQAIADPDMSPEKAASHLGMSTRSLHRMFASEGPSMMNWLWRQRLHRAHAMLVARQAATVTDAALACGYSSFSHFSQCFKREFGISPVRLRARALPHRGPPDTDLAPP